jgi:hypothetical protein
LCRLHIWKGPEKNRLSITNFWELVGRKGVNECGGTWATPSSRYVVEYYGKIERIVTFLGVRKGLIEKR